MKSACANYTKLLQYHKKKRGSSICGAANLHSGAHLWVDVPCISADVITYIKLRNVQHIAEIDTKNPLEYFLLREHVKSISAKNRDELKKNKSKVNELLSSGKSLKLLSAQENMATSDVALALLGRKYLKKENPQSKVPHKDKGLKDKAAPNLIDTEIKIKDGIKDSAATVMPSVVPQSPQPRGIQSTKAKIPRKIKGLMNTSPNLTVTSIKKKERTKDSAATLTPSVVSQSPPSQHEAQKLRIYEEAVEHAYDDHIAGYMLSSVAEAAKRTVAESSEKSLQEGLKEALNLTDADFKTEDEVRRSFSKDSPLPLTPDVYFHKPHEIMGRMCYWADAKNSVVIPGISPDKIVQKTKRQTDKYIEAFGPGMLFWGKVGFDQGIVDALSPEILHVTPKHVAAEIKKRSNTIIRKMKRRSFQY